MDNNSARIHWALARPATEREIARRFFGGRITLARRWIGAERWAGRLAGDRGGYWSAALPVPDVSGDPAWCEFLRLYAAF